MNYIKTIVCFANSRKTSGRCIAGKEWNNNVVGSWIRPVSIRFTHEISEEERRYQNGLHPKLLDIINIPCDVSQPVSHQGENHVIDPDYYWVKIGIIRWEDIQIFIDTPPSLWSLGHGSYTGLNNRVALGRENGISLHLISVERISLLVGKKAPEYPDSKRAVRGEFVYNGSTYRMDITDPAIEQNYLSQADGRYEVSNPILCISLGDLYDGYFYKLIAGVLYQEMFT